MTPNQEPVERELDEKYGILEIDTSGNPNRAYFKDVYFYNSLKKYISHQKALSRAEVLSQLEEYLTHHDDCILASWSAGRPTEDGGYESKYGGKWYQSRPIDKTPKCTCGLSDTLAVVDEIKNKEEV